MPRCDQAPFVALVNQANSFAVPWIPGLDPARYHKTAIVSTHDKEFFTFQSQISDKERFRDCERLILHCRGCRSDLPMFSIAEDIDMVSTMLN